MGEQDSAIGIGHPTWKLIGEELHVSGFDRPFFKNKGSRAELPGHYLSILVSDIVLHHQYEVLFAGEDGDMRPRKSFVGVTGGGILRDVKGIAVFGSDPIKALPVTITPYDEDGLDGGAWSKRAEKSWPVNILASFDRDAGAYDWSLGLYVPKPAFEEFCIAYRQGLVEEIDINIHADVWLNKDRQYIPESGILYLTPEREPRQSCRANASLTKFAWREQINKSEKPIEGEEARASPTGNFIEKRLRAIDDKVKWLLGLALMFAAIWLLKR